MLNEPTPEQLAKLPPILSTDEIPCEDRIIHLHFFVSKHDICNALFIHAYGNALQNSMPPCDHHWYVVEYDQETAICFGYFCFDNVRTGWGAWEYFSLDDLELLEIGPDRKQIVNDADWKPKKFLELLNAT